MGTSYNNLSFTDLQATVARALSGKKLAVKDGANHAPENPLRLDDAIYLSKHDHFNNNENQHYLRAQVDMAALAHRYHQRALHRHLRASMTDMAIRQISDNAELIRIETLATQHMPGVRHNISHFYTVDAAEAMAHYQQDPHKTPPMANIATALLREALTGALPPAPLASFIAQFRPVLAPKIAAHLEKMKRNIANQKQFHEALFQLLADLNWLQNLGESTNPGDETESENALALGLHEQDDSTNPSDSYEAEGLEIDADGEVMLDDQNTISTSQTGGSDIQKEMEEAPTLPNYQPSQPDFTPAYISGNYRVFTTKYDEIIAAEKLVDHDELQALYAKLQEKIQHHHTVSSRLAGRLQRLLLAQQTRHWMVDLDDGMIDNARLARVVARPDITDIYKRELDAPFRDTIVTLLIDNSGSMRGRPITLAAISADILARTLERCGVKVEILGFTTKEWKGGNSRKAWMDQGRPPNPGRLNDVRHIIYKAADTRFHKAHRNLALMLKDGILKENIDGEALLWAYKRLIARKEDRRILMVISDGAPVDDATLSANSGSYLDQHLREVIHFIEQDKHTELLAIGIGHDVTRYYQKAITLHDAEALGDTMVREVTKLFTPKGAQRKIIHGKKH